MGFLELARELLPYTRGARKALLESVWRGDVTLTEHGGHLGAWVETPKGRFFCSVAQVNLSHYEKSYVLDGDDDDVFDVWAEGVREQVLLRIDGLSGRIRNWNEVCENIRAEDYQEGSAYSLAECRRYLDPNQPGVGSAHKGGRYLSTCGNYELRDTLGRTGLPRKHIVHVKSGELAPSGTQVELPPEARGRVIAYIQAGDYAREIESPEALAARERKKLAELVALADSLPRLRKAVADAMADSYLTRRKVAAVIVTLCARHLFRVGSEVGRTVISSPEEELSAIDTFGITKVLPEHVREDGKMVEFAFPGKRGRPWVRVETDPAIIKVLRQLLNTAKRGVPLFRYELKNGDLKPITDEAVNDFLKSVGGFTVHRFRTHAASYTVYKELRHNEGVHLSLAQRKKIVAAALQQAADKLNDEPGTVRKSYVVGGIIEEYLETGSVRLREGFKRVSLDEKESAENWWLEDEEEFFNWIYAKYDEGLVELEEIVMLAAWPPLRPGDRWVTLKPHGPDHPDYRRVIIRQHKDGTAHIVWAGAKGLMNLKLTRIGQRAEIEARERRKTRLMTPEERAAEREKREQRREMIKKEEEAASRAIAAQLGVPEEYHSIISDLFAKRKIRFGQEEKTPEQRELDKQRLEEKVKRIMEGDTEGLEAPSGGGVDPGRFLDELALADILNEIPHAPKGLPAELRAALNKARKDRALAQKIMATRARFEERKRELAKEFGDTERQRLTVYGRMAFYSDPEENELALLRQAHERQFYEWHSRFWENFDEGIGSRYMYDQGAIDALTTLGTKYGLGVKINPGLVRILGAQTMAAAVAQHVRERGRAVREAALERVEEQIIKRSLPTVKEALGKADELAEERARIKSEYALGMLSDFAVASAVQKASIERLAHLARAAGSLEAAAAVADQLRQERVEGVTISGSDEIRDRIVATLTALGLQEDEDFKMATQDGKPAIHIPADKLTKLVAASHAATVRDKAIADIKSHKALPDDEDFEVPGLIERLPDGTPVKLKPAQKAVILMAEQQKRVLGNLQVGIGKTLAFGALAARMIGRGECKGGWYVVPTNLLYATQKELQKWFPEMDIAVAHGLSPAKRREKYTAGHQILLIGQDVLRIDVEHLKGLMGTEHAPGFIFGDEIQAMFTPGEDDTPEKMSQRSRALRSLRAPVMLAMTGTPMRRSSAEVWKMLDWLRPGEFGSLASWTLRYGRLGRGTTAFSDMLDDQFRAEIDHATITERETPKVKNKEQVARIDLSESQRAKYREIEERYQAEKKKGLTGKRLRSALGKKAQQQREVFFAGGGTNNPILMEMRDRVLARAHEGRRGLIHCTSLAAVRAVAAMFRPGECLTLTGEDDVARRRQEVIAAINDGRVIEGARVSVGQRAGVVVKIDGSFRRPKPSDTVHIKTDGGEVFTARLEDCSSRVIALAGTSNAQGVISTGLNLQKGTDYGIQLQLPDSAATMLQRNARYFRTGQLRDVETHYFVPNTPMHREKFRDLQAQVNMLNAFDDPAEYDDTDKLSAYWEANRAA